MAKDYFQDIVPPDDIDGATARQPAPSSSALPPPGDRGIRSINIQRPRPFGGETRPGGPMRPRPPMPPPEARGRRRWVWILCGLCVVALAAVGLLFFFRTTTVSVVPQSQTVTFDQSAQFTAYPAATAASGTIPYTVQTTDIEDSTVVKSSGTQHVDAKASGSITVVNNYSSSPVKLIRNTRFATASGLIFRVPADISVPGKSASAPGKVSVTVAADQPGGEYNIAPQTKFTIPGLQSAPAEYAQVYAYSAASTTGGFSGEQPAVAPADLSAAVGQIRASLQQKASAFADSLSTDSQTALAPRITFSDLPNTAEAGGSVRVHESAHVEVAVVPSDMFASAVAQTVAASASVGSVRLVPAAGYAATVADTSGAWGSDPLTFAISGHALLVWAVDTNALAEALAGRSEDAFQAIVSNFPGVQSAKARVEPFWESKFPSDSKDIHVSVEQPAEGK